MSKSITEEQRAALMEAIKLTDKRDLINVHNWVCRERGYEDDEIFSMYDIDEIVSLDGYKSAVDVFNLFNCDFKGHHDFFWYNGYGEICSGYACSAIEANADFDIIADTLAEICLDGALDDDLKLWIEDTLIWDWWEWMESEDTEDDAERAAD